jgi:hypothetical protein
MSPDSHERPSGCAVVISSCDAYSDLWPYFFHFFFRHWPHAPQPVYLIANHLRYDDPRVSTIQVGPDLQWGTNTRTAISQIKEDLVLLLLDDFLLDAPFPEETFTETLRQFQNAQGRLLELRLHGRQGELIKETWFRRSDPQNLCSGINSNLWQKDLLLEIASPGLNIWQCESRVRQLLRDGEQQFFFLDEDAPKQISFVEGVRGRFWKPEGVAFLKSHGLRPDLRRRPCPPQGQGMIPKLIRSLHKRRMGRQVLQPPADGLVKPLRLP